MYANEVLSILCLFCRTGAFCNARQEKFPRNPMPRVKLACLHAPIAFNGRMDDVREHQILNMECVQALYGHLSFRQEPFSTI